MNCYRDMYCYLFNQITDIKDQLEKMQQVREEMYIQLGEGDEGRAAVERITFPMQGKCAD